MGKKRIPINKKGRAGIPYKKLKIKPLVSKCICGKVVTNHHYLCDKCWNKKINEKNRKIRAKLKEQQRIEGAKNLIITIKTKNKPRFIRVYNQLKRLGKITMLGITIKMNQEALDFIKNEEKRDETHKE